MATDEFTDGAGPSISGIRVQDLQILVLDTNAEATAHARDILTGAGYRRVEAFDDPAVLTNHAPPNHPDILLIAANLTAIDGRDTVAAFKADRTGRQTAVIVMTEEPDPAAGVEYLRQGAADFVARPLVPAVFLHRVEIQARLIAAAHEARELNAIIDRRTGRMNTALGLLRATEKRLTDELNSVQGENRARINYFAETNHELRTPLNAICGMSDVIRLESLGPIGNEKYKEYAKNIYDAGRHLLGLMDSRLSMSRIEAGAEALEIEEVNVGGVIEETSKMLGTMAAKADVSLDVQIEPDLPVIETDKGKLRQVMVNLLTNAIKFTPERGRVLLTAKRNEKKGVLVLVVSDTGIGMTAEDLHAVMTPYHRIPRGDDQGSGLGLPIAKKLVEMMGGAIEMRSMKGRGTSVRIELPITAPGRASTDQDAA